MGKTSINRQEVLDKLYAEITPTTEKNERAKGKIVEVNTGTVSDFIPEEHIRGEPLAKAIQFKVLTPDNYTINITGKLSLHPMAKFYRLTKALGHKPQIGDEVALIFDGSFWRADI